MLFASKKISAQFPSLLRRAAWRSPLYFNEGLSALQNAVESMLRTYG
jgi:hypothetical protein